MSLWYPQPWETAPPVYDMSKAITMKELKKFVKLETKEMHEVLNEPYENHYTTTKMVDYIENNKEKFSKDEKIQNITILKMKIAILKYKNRGKPYKNHHEPADEVLLDYQFDPSEMYNDKDFDMLLNYT